MGVGGAAALATLGVPAWGQTSKPNILWIVDDDHPAKEDRGMEHLAVSYADAHVGNGPISPMLPEEE